MGVVMVTWSIFIISAPPRRIFGMDEDRQFKFGMQIDRGDY